MKLGLGLALFIVFLSCAVFAQTAPAHIPFELHTESNQLDNVCLDPNGLAVRAVLENSAPLDASTNVFKLRGRSIVRDLEELVLLKTKELEKFDKFPELNVMDENSRLGQIDLNSYLIVHRAFKTNFEVSNRRLSEAVESQSNTLIVLLSGHKGLLDKLLQDKTLVDEGVNKISLIDKNEEVLKWWYEYQEIHKVLSNKVQGLKSSIDSFIYCHYNLLPEISNVKKYIATKRRYTNFLIRMPSKTLAGATDEITTIMDIIYEQRQDLEEYLVGHQAEIQSFYEVQRRNNVGEMEKKWKKALRKLKHANFVVDVNRLLARGLYLDGIEKNQKIYALTLRAKLMRDQILSLKSFVDNLYKLEKEVKENDREHARKLRNELRIQRETLMSLHGQFVDIFLEVAEKFNMEREKVSLVVERYFHLMKLSFEVIGK